MTRSTWKLLTLCVTLLTTPAHAGVRIGLATPLTGPLAWGGATERRAEAAVADLKTRGGVLGQQVESVMADDYCDDDHN
jgi:ABC-type branched-subunit amino acid transport system substrate-binding protein